MAAGNEIKMLKPLATSKGQRFINSNINFARRPFKTGFMEEGHFERIYCITHTKS